MYIYETSLACRDGVELFLITRYCVGEEPESLF